MENRNAANIDAKVYPIREPKGNQLANASITVAGMFAIKGVKVMNGKNGPFVSMPQAKDSKGEWKDIAFPVTREGREELSRVVLAAYDKEISQNRDQATPQKAAPVQGHSQQNSAPRQNPNSYRNSR